VGVRVGVADSRNKLALRTRLRNLSLRNLRCARSSGICMPNPKSLALIVS